MLTYEHIAIAECGISDKRMLYMLLYLQGERYTRLF